MKATNHNHTIDKSHKVLGFTAMETAEVVTSLNKLLAACQIHQQRLKQFHWNVVGKDFFELHELFDKHAQDMVQHVDNIAERIRVFGKKPLGTFTEYLDASEIHETNRNLTSIDMVNYLLSDYRVLMSLMVDAVTLAGENGDIGTTVIINQMIHEIEKKHWQLTAWADQDAYDVTP